MNINMAQQPKITFVLICWIIVALFKGRTLADSSLLSELTLQSTTSGIFCDNIPGLSEVQKMTCRNSPDLMMSVRLGIQMAIEECQHQFRNHRWNCTTVYAGGDDSFFSKFMTRGSKEVAFVHAITSAAVTQTLAKACSDGVLQNCECDPTKHGIGKDSKGEFEWTGCSDNVKFGIRFARQFLDEKPSKSKDGKGLMNLHNNSAGRRGVTKHIKLKCKCHGVSGSCSMRTCWQAMQDFAHVGDFLKKRYDRARLTTVTQDSRGLIPLTAAQREVKKTDIVYVEPSPDYCLYDPNVGSIGTEDRLCNSTSKKSDGCEVMCCGSGYHTKTIQEIINCGCKFEWCCSVKCKLCTLIKDVHTCKRATPENIKTNAIPKHKS